MAIIISKIAPRFELPKDHLPGMRVPKGGSSCAKCEYLKSDGESCGNEHFIKWHGSEKLPFAADEYCSDWFEAKESDDYDPDDD